LQHREVRRIKQRATGGLRLKRAGDSVSVKAGGFGKATSQQSESYPQIVKMIVVEQSREIL